MSVEIPSARTAELERRATVHAALADPTRLRVVDLLAFTDLMPSELASSLGIGSNLLAHHLRILEDAGLIERLPSEGDGRRRYLRLIPTARGELAPARAPILADRVLFVCTGNSARSQLAAAIWNRSSEVAAESAGTHPADAVHPEAIRAGRAAGVDLRGARPRALAELDDAPDLVVTVCDRAHEALAAPAGATVLHWWVPDPRANGTPAAFDETVHRLRSRIDTLGPHVAPAGRRRRSARRSRP